MNRADAVTIITARLEEADDATLVAAAAYLDARAENQDMIVEGNLEFSPTGAVVLSPRELALLEQAKADFREGRTYSVEEVSAHIDEALARQRQRLAAE